MTGTANRLSTVTISYNRRTEMERIAQIFTDFPSKFGLPRQSGLVPELKGKIVFEPAYRNPEALRGIEGFSHLWLLWEFSESRKQREQQQLLTEKKGGQRETKKSPHWSATVKPPRLGGNRKMGVFATRSPFRPNPIGLSCVRLERIAFEKKAGPILYISGIDLMNGTPIYDIKPYLPHVDCHPEAAAGFAGDYVGYQLEVQFPEELLSKLPKEKQRAARAMLAQDPRPSYQNDENRRYGVFFDRFNISFMVSKGVLTVLDVEEIA